MASVSQQRVMRLRAAFQSRGGALYNPGETVAMPEDVAADLVTRGIAEPVTPSPQPETEETPAMSANGKSLDRPPRDTMLRRPPVKKGGR